MASPAVIDARRVRGLPTVGGIDVASLPGSILRGDLLRNFHVAVGHLATEVIARQLECHLAVSDVDVWMMVDGLEVDNEAVDEAERVDEVLELECPCQLVAGQLPSGQPRHDRVELAPFKNPRLIHSPNGEWPTDHSRCREPL